MTRDELLDSLRRAYDAAATVRDSSRVEPWKAAERERFLAILRAESKTTLLDAGAGTGAHALWFQEQGLKVQAIDLSPVLVALGVAKGLNARVADFEHPGLEPESLDAVWCMNALLHVPRERLGRALTRLRSLLKPGGLLYWGQYGGFDFEGVWQDDTYEPKRFFSYMTNEEMEGEASALFELLDFQFITMDGRGGADYQAVTVRKAGGSSRDVEERA